MIKTNFVNLIIVVIILFTTTCGKGFDDCHDSMYLENKSSSTIYYASTLKDGFLNYDPSSPTHATDYKIEAGKTRKIRIGITLSCWEQVMKSAEGYIYIYVYDAVRLEAEGWSNVKDKPLKKYSLKTNQLSEMEWRVTYP
ncbi:MAG: hypothetical protein VB075_09150 [Petrimonas sp.]|uniref:hypothetical protein n=1 Tax=Petrimonas sp. TaxID=2023866 RepID=UPI002B3E2D2C|nr:hypothetical protein [Petrimonas sp.]